MSDSDNILLKTNFNAELAKGYISPFTLTCSSPIFFVVKSDGSKCLCVNYRAMDEITVKNCYTIPSSKALADGLLGSTIFSNFDILPAFNQIRVANGHEWKTAFMYEFWTLKTNL